MFSKTKFVLAAAIVLSTAFSASAATIATTPKGDVGFNEKPPPGYFGNWGFNPGGEY